MGRINASLEGCENTVSLAKSAASCSKAARRSSAHWRAAEEAQRCGYTVALYIVALDDPARLLSRVAQRVREGGHAVPPERILARYPRTMDNLARAVRQADVSYLYDAAEVDGTGPQLVAVCSPTEVTPLAQPLPAWALRLTER